MDNPEKSKGLTRRDVLIKGAVMGAGALATAMVGKKAWDVVSEFQDENERGRQLAEGQRAERIERQKQILEYLASEWNTKIVAVREGEGPPGPSHEYKVRLPDGEDLIIEDLTEIRVHRRGGDIQIPGEEQPILPEGVTQQDYKEIILEGLPPEPAVEVVFFGIGSSYTAIQLRQQPDGSIAVVREEK